ncbi:NAD-dependent protein deacetylase [Actinokineospora sp. NBRC 105648]|uniref:NAD-dependent protein deacetylase n=1 Tax=Actinokineospora sp. NBRC 105648 TaxID=3032206 RepID=UPI0024A55FFA|nr:NAD-dependent protein deacetylase [Actinokineospora sp. NBRC 105648]GLZ42312.1 NAD-dependent protein deacetylase [Actinokineospora sp. NBRC 105648]
MRTRPTLSWTASGAPLPRTTSLDEVVEAVTRGGVVVLSGAGLSTESGIPDYRGAAGSLRRHTPMTYDEFVGAVDARRRYWARSHIGWRTIARASPNDGHRTVTALHAAGYVDAVITQNVDGLHGAAGTPGVVELHGSLDRVICLDCGSTGPREELDRRLRAANPEFTAAPAPINPDGDVDLPAEAVLGFHLVDCAHCGGVLKPDVVFFGENVPRARVEQCNRLVDEAESLLVLGSSLTVMSGLRFVRRAAAAGKPVLIITHGQTRGDACATVRVDLPLGRALGDLATRLALPDRTTHQD